MSTNDCPVCGTRGGRFITHVCIVLIPPVTLAEPLRFTTTTCVGGKPWSAVGSDDGVASSPASSPAEGLAGQPEDGES